MWLDAWKQVDLVEHQQLRHGLRAYFCQDLIDFKNVIWMKFICRVHDMDKKIRLSCLLKRSTKRFNQLMWQMANETYRIGDDHRSIVLQGNTA